MPWAPGEPNNGEVEKSGEIELRSSDWSNFQWNDRPLDYVLQDSWYICEKEGCEEGWKLHGSKCYYFGTNVLSWTEAEDYCQGKGGHLAKDTEDVHSFLSSEVASLDTSGCSPIYMCNPYIGLLYEPGVGYKWSDGSAVDESFMPWAPGEPNNGEVEKSGEIELRSSDWSNFQWNDRPLDYVLQDSWYICEKEV
ncbi:asialoglycoprotein receptor 1-like [Ptychodera flava]|uniref:asialoglycoprotein receptor 1-like n=1 Tax=Ptychodera flava TaxID=63121 RepID=UPI003969ED37